MMRIRESVRKFSVLMEKQLSLKDSIKGEKGWKNLSSDYLFSKIMSHRILAYQAYMEGNKEKSIKHLIHLSNYSMMIVDNLSYIMEVEG